MAMSKPANWRESPRQLPLKSLHFNGFALALRLHFRASMVLRIEPAPNDSPTLLKLVGRIASPDVQQLKALIAEMPNPVALDLQEVELVDLDAVRFLAAVERGGLVLRNLPPYVRAWVLLERERLGDSE